MTESSAERPQGQPADDALQFRLQLGDLKRPLVAGRSYTIGKESSCDVRLGHGSVSPVHCRLEIRPDQVFVHDLNSLCGTKVDGQPVMDGPWLPGQVLEVGDIRIELLAAGPAATTATAAASAAAAELVSQRHDQAFGDIMFQELKRAPWLALSIVVHAVVLMILWFALQHDVPLGSDGLVVAMDEAESEEEIADDEIEEEVVSEEQLDDTEFNETEVEETEEQLFFDEGDLPDYGSGLGDTTDLMQKVGSGIGDILKSGNALSGKFKKTVAGLRKNGLEIVFVFDSTGSMGSVLSAAKERMAKMVSVLHELVPYARIGVITFRDHGEGEDYLLRKVVLSRDFYRSMNFLQTVYAGGGGDEPEAVYDALREAVTQKWSPTARRLVVLIGDAPPHQKTEGRIASMVKSFARNDRSQVHAIITQPSGGTDIAKTTERTFRRIARDGRGEALAFEDEGKILKAVMNLAFGRKESRSIDEVYRLAELRGKRVSSRSKKLASGKYPDKLKLEFKKKVVSNDLIKAILLDPKAGVLNQLVDFASSRSFPNAGKHAASYVLQKTLLLDEPPVDPESSRPLSKRRADTYKRYIGRKFD